MSKVLKFIATAVIEAIAGAGIEKAIEKIERKTPSEIQEMEDKVIDAYRDVRLFVDKAFEDKIDLTDIMENPEYKNKQKYYIDVKREYNELRLKESDLKQKLKNINGKKETE